LLYVIGVKIAYEKEVFFLKENGQG